MVSENGIRAHLHDKVEEWLDWVKVSRQHFQTLELAEQAFKDWLWGEKHG